MREFARNVVLGMLVLPAVLLWTAWASGPPATVIRKVEIMGSGSNVELEVAASTPVTPQAQLLANPNRLVLDFSNASMGSGLHALSTPRGPIGGVRVGLLSNNPPVTRVVVDLTGPQKYELFPSGNNVIVKLSSAGSATAAAPAFQTEFEVVDNAPMPQTPTASVPATPPAPKVQVDYQGGLLTIAATKATLAEVLFEIQKKTGADIPIPAGAAGDQVVTKIGPVPPGAALAALLNGSSFNFIMVGSDDTPSQLRSVLIFPKGGSPPQAANATPQLTPRPAVSQPPEPAPEEVAPLSGGGPPINPVTGLPEEPQPDQPQPQPEQQPAPQ